MASGRVSKVKGKVLDIPTAPTIGTATAGAESASVAFTASTVGGPVFTYTALSNPGSVTGSGTTSPVTVSGLTVGTAYTFTVRGNNPTGDSEYSSASGSITPTAGSSYESIATTTVGSGGASTISFTSIPATYKNLQIRIATLGSTADDIAMKVNSTVGLKTHWLRGNQSTAAGLVNNPWSTYGLYVSENGVSTTNPTPLIIDLLDYTSTNKNKVIRFIGGRDDNGSGRVWLAGALFDDLTAVSSITFTSSFGQYSSIALYGIKGA